MKKQAQAPKRAQGNPELVFSQSVIDEILATVGSKEPETGGILGANLQKSPWYIEKYHFCSAATVNGREQASYTHFSPDHNEINDIVDNAWAPEEYWLTGIVHSHPGMMNKLSTGNGLNNDGDMTYFQNIINHEESKKFGLKRFFAPIVNFSPSGKIHFTFYLVAPGENKPTELFPRVYLKNDSLITFCEYVA